MNSFYNQPIFYGTGIAPGTTEFSSYPWNFGQTPWAKRTHKRVAAMRKEVRNDAARKEAAAAKRERRKLRNRMGYGTGHPAEYKE